MKLFKIEAHFKTKHKGRYGVDVIVHAKTKAAAEEHVAGKFTGCKIVSSIELKGTATKHFVIADLVVDEPKT